MSRFPFVHAVAFGLLLLNFSAGPGTAAPGGLTPDQVSRLKQVLPKTLAKLERRELLRVVSIGDSISTFYQPPGFPRYDAAMSWQGRLLNRLGGYYFYHGIVEVDPHREILTSQKEATAAWARFTAEMEVWQRTKKGAEPKQLDALRFRADLESPVSMNVPELMRRGVPVAQQPVPGTAIQIHNLARDGAQAPQAMEALTTEAFPSLPLAPPDLVTICYGVNDAVGGLPLDGYRGFLTKAVEYSLKRGAEVLLAAPPVSFDPVAARLSLGRTRPYAQVAREVAQATGAAFVDLGAALVEAPSDLFSLTVNDAFAAAMVPAARDFTYRSETPDTLHPNAAATLRMGENAARQLTGSAIPGPIEVTGHLEITGPGEATATIRIFNPAKAARTVVLSPLSFTGWQIKPGTADALFNLPPGKARRYNIPLTPTSVGPAPDRGLVRGSLIVSDDDRQQLADVALPVLPAALIWPEGRFDAASGDLLLTSTLTNQGFETIQGAANIQWQGRSQEVPFKLEPKQKIPLPIRLALPDPAAAPRFRDTVVVVITLPDRTLRFTRHVAGVRHLGLEQRFPLIPTDPLPDGKSASQPDTWVTPFADARGLYFLVDAPNSSSAALPAGMPWGGIEVQLDGRKAGENGTAGFVDRITAPLPAADGPVALHKIRPAVFGEGYNFDYHPDGFRFSATTRADGSRSIECNIARVNLAAHEWSLDGSGQNTLGFNLRLTRNDPATGQPDPAATRVVTAASFGITDARSLTILELSRTPAPRWSVRVW